MSRRNLEDDMRRLVEETGHEIDLIKEVMAASKALDRPKVSGPPPLPVSSRKPMILTPSRETLAGRIALVDAA